MITCGGFPEKHVALITGEAFGLILELLGSSVPEFTCESIDVNTTLPKWVVK